jgi:hypothetical protein
MAMLWSGESEFKIRLVSKPAWRFIFAAVYTVPINAVSGDADSFLIGHNQMREPRRFMLDMQEITLFISSKSVLGMPFNGREQHFL